MPDGIRTGLVDAILNVLNASREPLSAREIFERVGPAVRVDQVCSAVAKLRVEGRVAWAGERERGRGRGPGKVKLFTMPDRAAAELSAVERSVGRELEHFAPTLFGTSRGRVFFGVLSDGGFVVEADGKEIHLGPDDYAALKRFIAQTEGREEDQA